jgi:branched-chain amino acid transport system substrate-binding protein
VSSTPGTAVSAGNAPASPSGSAAIPKSASAAAPPKAGSAASPGATPSKPGQPAPGQPAPAAGGAGASDVGVSPSVIKVGHIGIYSGPVGSFGDDLSHACRAGLQFANDSGGINGRKLDVIVRDDGWDATKGSNAGRDLVERQKVFALACTMSVPTNDALTPYMDQQKVPNVGIDGWGEAQYAGTWSFPVGASGVNQAENLADYQAKQQGAKRVGVLYWNNSTGKAYLEAYKKVVKEHGGEVVVAQAANFDDPGTSTFIAQSRANNVDTITTQIDPGIFARMVREAAAQGYRPKNGYSGSAALYFQATPGLTGPSAEGTIAAIDWTPDDPQGPAATSPGYRTYKQTVERYYPNIDHSNWTKAGYVGARVFTDALKRLGLNVTRQALKDDLDRLTDFETGLGPKISFRPGQHRANKTTYLVQLKNVGGKLEWKHIFGPVDNPRRSRS